MTATCPDIREGAPTSPAALGTWQRRVLFAMVLSAGLLNLVDRQIISVLKPAISADLHWSDEDYGSLAAWFQGSAAFGLLFAGWVADRLGTRWANPFAVAAWSLAAIAHGWARSMTSFIACRVALGATEAMGTPIGIKTVAVILPHHQRSAGIGIGSAIQSVGAILAPFAIPLVAAAYGWRGTFIFAGAAGLIWATIWFAISRSIPLDTVPVSPGLANSYGPLLTDRRTWAIAGGKVLSDASWWLLLFWMPDFFFRRFGVAGLEIGLPLAIAYCGSAAGSLAGGLASTWLQGRGLEAVMVRKALMFGFALLAVPAAIAAWTQSYGLAVSLMALILFAHQGFSTNLFALIADVTPQDKVGRVTSFGAFCGNVGGMVIVKLAGTVLAAGAGFLPLLLFVSVAYVSAISWINLVLPRR